MAMLTVPGLTRLFPHTGPGSADALLDLGALAGDATSHALAADVSAAWEPGAIAGRLDRWLLARLAAVEPAPGLARFAAAGEVLRAGGTVEAAARHAEVTRRQLHRWFCRHVGLGPKQLMDLERLHASLQAVQSEQGDPVAGYSDQAHQIRSWRRWLGDTPGAYARQPRSPMAAYFGAGARSTTPAFYL
jgi:AraC-like DNA-binding protein